MRRRKAEVREIEGDKLYNDFLIAKFINCFMYDGKKSVAEKIVYHSLEGALKKIGGGETVVSILRRIVDNVQPKFEVRSRRVGGATYQVPVEVRPSRRIFLAIKWLVQSAREKKGMATGVALVDEFFDAFNSTGGAVAKRDRVLKLVEDNRAFAHYRW